MEGAAANDLPDPVPDDIKAERARELMQRQASISARRLAARVGSVEQVLVDEVVEADTIVARSYGDAPEIDGRVYVEFAEGVGPGDWLDVEIIASDEHDRVARPMRPGASAG